MAAPAGFRRSSAIRFNIYGLTGILLAHVFFNLPLATRLLLQQLEGIQPESWRLAAQLDFTPMARFAPHRMAADAGKPSRHSEPDLPSLCGELSPSC